MTSLHSFNHAVVHSCNQSSIARDAASRALDLRKKQFALLLHAARELSGELEEDEKVAEEAQAVDAMET